MLERRDVCFPMWRKKVDNTLLKDFSTPIPNWLLSIWKIESRFSSARSVKSEESKIRIFFEKLEYEGRIVKKRYNGQYRYAIVFPENLGLELRNKYVMTYMRLLESQLSSKNSRNIENDISFWEFLDIEINPLKKELILTSHYKLKPTFPNLFKELVKSSAIRKLHAVCVEKNLRKILSTDFKPRDMYSKELSAYNVIYNLIDTKNKLFYIGEANDLKSRFDNGHKEIPHWDYYRYAQLPNHLQEDRVYIERMIITMFYALLKETVNNSV